MMEVHHFTGLPWMVICMYAGSFLSWFMTKTLLTMKEIHHFTWLLRMVIYACRLIVEKIEEKILATIIGLHHFARLLSMVCWLCAHPSHTDPELKISFRNSAEILSLEINPFLPQNLLGICQNFLKNRIHLSGPENCQKFTQNSQKMPWVEFKNPLKLMNYRCDNFQLAFVGEKIEVFFHIWGWKRLSFRMRFWILDQCATWRLFFKNCKFTP